ncbi:FeoA family protein [Lacticaseibacillus jixiensis]|uniref:FeoA family protein n=1 Tax=Lacticaseibacillus jixiensis TaxID=3231926 RepID=UPI0036F2C078
MQTLTQLRQTGDYIIMAVLGRERLTKHLAELGMLPGKRLTVIQTSSGNTGMLVYFQGQRLAMSDEIAEQIAVRPFNAEASEDAVPLSALKLHRSGIVAKLAGQPALRHRLMDMGLTKGTLVKVYNVAPLGDPIELVVRGYKLSLRKAEAAQILVEEVGAIG